MASPEEIPPDVTVVTENAAGIEEDIRATYRCLRRFQPEKFGATGMNSFSPVTDLRDIDRAVLSAAGVLRDFSNSAVCRPLSPTQFLTVMTIAAFDLSIAKGSDPRSAAMKLRQIADALEQG